MNDEQIIGTIVYRTLTPEAGLVEHQAHFGSLGELLSLIWAADGRMLVDRISIQGQDEQQQQRVVRFVFQSQQVLP